MIRALNTRLALLALLGTLLASPAGVATGASPAAAAPAPTSAPAPAGSGLVSPPAHVLPADPQAPPPGNTCELVRGDYAELTADEVRAVQDALAFFRLYLIPIDGIFGRETRAGMIQYCRDHRITERSRLLPDLLRDLPISRVYPNWHSLVRSLEFRKWAAGEKDASEIREALLSGSALEVIKIIDRFFRPRPGTPPPPAQWHEDSHVSYQLTADDLKALSSQLDALSQLETLKNQAFQDETSFFSAVDKLLKDEAPRYRNLIARNAEVLPTYQISAEGLERLRVIKTPEAVLTQLEILIAPGLPSRKEADTLIRQVIADVADSRPFLQAIQNEVQEVKAYRLANTTWAAVVGQDGLMPAAILALLDNLQDLEFPERQLFIAAAANKVNAQADLHALKMQEMIGARQLRSLDDKALEAFKQEGVPESLIALIADLKDKPFPDTAALQWEVEHRINELKARFPAYQNQISSQARKKHAYDPDSKLQWASVPDCHCLPSHPKGVVYGFYPYWLSSAPISIDFGVFGRLGYYALSMNNHGELEDEGHWSPKNGDAIETARRYRTKLDLVISKRDWSAWAAQTKPQKEESFRQLVDNIERMLGLPLEDSLSRSRPWISPGSSVPRLGDGITLYFDNFPTDPDSVELFRQLIRQLHERINDGRRFLNLMFSHGNIGKGAYDYANLLRWAQLYGGKSEEGSEVNDHMLFLVLLEEPVTGSETRLRLKVEEGQKGQARRNLLRMIVPVLTPDPETHLNEHIVYMQDNFGGIGFWALPHDKAGESIAQALKMEYIPQGTHQSTPLCRIVCPNRWAFRIAFDLFVILSLCVLVVYLRCCECRSTYSKHALPILATTAIPSFTLGMLLLLCDPSLEKIANGNWPLLVMGLGVIGYAVWNARKGGREIP
ncbi:MAG: hypothetical protein RIR00_1770 [Pseudomonadota bacterium]|jgi:hypothetical protein